MMQLSCGKEECLHTKVRTLGLVKRIDLSSSRLTGDRYQFTDLVGLVSLNLSRNHLTGQITPDIGKLQSLDSLDISRNQIDGAIPTSLARIDRLAYLDLSYNRLSGEIPTGTQLKGFDASVFVETLSCVDLHFKRCVLRNDKMCRMTKKIGMRS
ncbi:receptor-like protein EIX1 [Rosa rugosa]|uniref:receptor-like protein EIX1 n=1 Tax=Rosa rugosa TaxID=74645 RepID=UPI002B4048DD|nr:receptor-like protein EIX1 [Rosa rugosa]